MNKPLNIIIVLLCIISIPFIYITFTPNNTEIVVLPGLVIPKPTQVATSSMYNNQEYRFTLDLPESWNGFSATTTIISDGVQVTLRHPMWTKESARADIPILIYPLVTWTKWEESNFEGYKTAAPIPPTERGRNAKYVFATAPRYNFSFLPGFEEVEVIIETLKGV